MSAFREVMDPKLIAKRMVMSKPTQGPWQAVNWTCHAPITIKAGDVVVADLAGTGRHSDECVADALLIAAAKELLAAVECAMAINGVPELCYPLLARHGHKHDPDLREADYSQAVAFVDALCRAAFAKATGSAA